MKRRPLTQDQKQEIDRLRSEKGWTYDRIAKRLEVSISSIQWYCLIYGVEKPGTAPDMSKIKRDQYNYQRNGFPVRAFTEQEDRLLLSLSMQGLGYSEIGKRLNRRHNSVQGRLAALARREERQQQRMQQS